MARPGPEAHHNSVGSTDRTGASGPHTRPGDWKGVEDLLALLARAVQQLHTYPSTSPLCVNAVDACARALASLGREQLICRITPSALMVDDLSIGAGAPVAHELARRLHKASVASVTLHRGASPREVGRFCEDLVRCGRRTAGGNSLLEMLAEHGVSAVTVEMACRPEVLPVTAAGAHTVDDVRRERERFEAQLARGGAIGHLYPPGRGWVRIDPSAAPPAVSLLDLAVLADDPAALAGMLLRLTGEGDDVRPADALQRKYSDVTMLISALDPPVARRMFGKLARAVLDLEPESRQALLRRTVLPGLLDGRVDGAILRDFPDVDLAESLCLLLDLETAAPELLSSALSRLQLSPERHDAMIPLLDARLREREGAAAGHQTTLVRHARELVRVEVAGEKSFAEFAAFDLSLDAQAASTLDHIRHDVPATDVTATQLTCLWHLICLEPSPESVSGFLDRSLALLCGLERGGRAADLPEWLWAYRHHAERVRESRPDVSAVIASQLASFCTPARAAWLVESWMGEPAGRATVGAVVAALGFPIVAPLVQILEYDSATPEKGSGRPPEGRGRAVAQLLTEHGRALAPAIPPLLDGSSPAVRRALLRVLGTSGDGYERHIAAWLSPGDEPTAREALRALARLGTPKAACLVVAAIEKGRGALSVAAEETLWHFPLQEAQRQTRTLLANRDFAVSNPQATERLLDRVARAGALGLEPVLLGLAPMRFRLWNPALARMARKANAMLKEPQKPQARL